MRRYTREHARRLRARLAGRGRWLAARAAPLCAGWWVLGEGTLEGAGFGALVIALALVAGLATPGTEPVVWWRARGLARLARYFVTGSLRGGLDVAHRALGPGPRVAPAVWACPLQLETSHGRNLMTGVLNLMPGTLSIAIEEHRLVLHVLVESPGVAEGVARLEQEVARATGELREAPRG